MHFDYTTVGHVTIDVLADGTRRAGGTAFYSALQAARLGRRTLIVTQGVPQEIEELVEPYRGELKLEIHAAGETTTLETLGSGAGRTQRVLAWAGAMDASPTLDGGILHLAPIARECPSGWQGRCELVGLTPQGLAREWSAGDGRISLGAPGTLAEQLARGCQAIVVSEHERASCSALIAAAGRAGALVAITDGPAPTRILLADGRVLELAVAPVAVPGDDLGAGDVFAAAFFIALAERRDPLDAAAFANAAAAVRMLGAGAEAIGDSAAIRSRLHALSG